MTLKEFIQKGLSEGDNPSSMRINIFYAVIILIPCIALSLVYVLFRYPDQLQAVLNAILIFVSGLFAAKVLQKDKEQ